MARPKRSETSIKATEKIEDAFWVMLSHGSYHNITIRSLAKEAGVNHNLIYYYYENIDDIAKKAFYNTISEEACASILTMLENHNFTPDIFTENPSLMERFTKARLYVRGDSAYLTSIFETAIKSTWLKQAGIKEEDLNEIDKIDLNFIIAGLSSVIANPLIYTNTNAALSLLDRELGKGIIATINRLKAKH